MIFILHDEHDINTLKCEKYNCFNSSRLSKGKKNTTFHKLTSFSEAGQGIKSRYQRQDSSVTTTCDKTHDATPAFPSKRLPPLPPPNSLPSSLPTLFPPLKTWWLQLRLPFCGKTL